MRTEYYRVSFSSFSDEIKKLASDHLSSLALAGAVAGGLGLPAYSYLRRKMEEAEAAREGRKLTDYDTFNHLVPKLYMGIGGGAVIGAGTGALLDIAKSRGIIGNASAIREQLQNANSGSIGSSAKKPVESNSTARTTRVEIPADHLAKMKTTLMEVFTKNPELKKNVSEYLESNYGVNS